jgi:hypothetical protein
MALTQKAKQAKLLKKQKKRKLQLKQKLKNKTSQYNLAVIKSGYIHECFISDPNEQTPFYSIIASRISDINNLVTMVHFLIDSSYGIEDAFVITETETSFQNIKQSLINSQGLILEPLQPEIAKKFILDAITHAKSLGHNPHPDFYILKEIFFDIDETKYPVQFEFD